jgi:hypothetical protein
VSEIRTPPRRLVDLNPKWVKTHGGSEAYGIRYDCPCGKPGGPGPTHPDVIDGICPMGGWAVVPTKSNFIGLPTCADSLARGWDTSGDSFENITLSPSIHHVGHWHGFLRSGVLESC